jgi:thiamine biosynthesis lipoprotein
MAVLHLNEGGVATSSARHGRWMVDGKGACHVVDPTTGATVDTDVASATVIAAQAWMAEVVATSVVVAGVQGGVHLTTELGLDAIVVDRDGTTVSTGRLEMAS